MSFRFSRLRFHYRSPFAIVACLAAHWLLSATAAHVLAVQATQKTEPSTPAQITRWIEELGHESFTVRQAAAENLRSAGGAAREPLLNVAEGPDPEIRAAARRLLSLIETSDFRRRLNEFAADADGSAGKTLPGWDAFKKLVGSDAPDRALFVEMQRQDSAWLATAFGKRGVNFMSNWENRLQRMMSEQVNGRNPSTQQGSAAAMYFLAALPEMEPSDEVIGLLSNLTHRAQLADSLRAGTNRESLRRLLVAWVLQCPNKSEVALQSRLNMALSNQLIETLPLAVAIAARSKSYENATLQNRMYALTLIGRMGGPEQVDPLEPLLLDRTLCLPAEAFGRVGGPEGGANVELRDIALVVLLRITHQDPAEYGYPHAQRPESEDLSVQLMFPTSNEQRDAAIAKWRRWKQEHKGNLRESQRSRVEAARNSGPAK